MPKTRDMERAEGVRRVIEQVRSCVPPVVWWKPWTWGYKQLRLRVHEATLPLHAWVGGGIGLIGIQAFYEAIDANEKLGAEVAEWNRAMERGLTREEAIEEGLREVPNTELDAALAQVTEARRLMFSLLELAD